MSAHIERLAREIVAGLGDHLETVEAALAESEAMYMATLRVVSDQYAGAVKWALTSDERKCLDAQIRTELMRIRRW